MEKETGHGHGSCYNHNIIHNYYKHAVLAAFTGLIIAETVLAQSTSVSLAWDPDTNPSVVGYRLHSGTSSGVYPQTMDVGNVTAASVSNLTIGTTYYFVVTAYNNSSVESPPSNEISYVAGTTVTPTPTPTPIATPRPTVNPFPTPTPTSSPRPTSTPTPAPSATPSSTPASVPATPTNLVAQSLSSTWIFLWWIDNLKSVRGFNIERSTDGITFAQVATVPANTTTYLNSGLAGSTRYYYRVYAYNGAGNSGYSNIASAATAGSTMPSSTPAPSATPTPAPTTTPIPTPTATPTVTPRATPTVTPTPVPVPPTQPGDHPRLGLGG